MTENRLSLRARLFILLGLMIFQNIAGPCFSIYFTNQTRSTYSTVVDRDMESLMAALKLEKALIMQKGFATYYYLTGSREWLESLKGYHEQFNDALGRSINTAYLPGSSSILEEVRSRYARYVDERDMVIRFYEEGRKQDGINLHWKVREQFFAIYSLCEN